MSGPKSGGVSSLQMLLGKTLSEVTAAEWQAFLESNPEFKAGLADLTRTLREIAAGARLVRQQVARAWVMEHAPGLAPKEMEDLERRLLAAIGQGFIEIEAAVQAAEASGNPFVREAWNAMWAEVEKRRGPVPPEQRTIDTWRRLPPSATGWESLFRIEAALAWPEVWHGWRSDNAAAIGAREALAWLTVKQSDPYAERPDALDRLQGETARALEEAQAAIGRSRVGPRVARYLADEERDGMLAIDADAADWLERLDATAAEQFRSRRRRALVAWRNDPGRDDPELPLGDPARPSPPWDFWRDWAEFAQALALVLWVVRVQPELERRPTHDPPALLFGVYDSVMLFATPGIHVDKDESGQLALFRPNPAKPRFGEPIAVAEMPRLENVPAGVFPEVIEQAMQIALKTPSSYFAIPYVEALAIESQRLYFEGKGGERIDTEGAWTAWTARVLGISEDEVRPGDRRAIRRLGWFFATTPIRWRDGARSSSLVSIHEDALAAGRGRGRGTLTHMLSPRLQYGEFFRAVQNLEEAATPTHWRLWRLVPLPGRVIPALPRSKPNTRGPQIVFSRRVYLHFVDRREEMAAEGFVQIPPSKALEIARASQLPEKYAQPMLAWMAEHGMLQTDGRNGFAPADEVARRFIAEGAKKSEEAARRAARRGRARGRR